MKRPVYAVLLLAVGAGIALGFGQAFELSVNRDAEVDAVLTQDCVAKQADSSLIRSSQEIESDCRRDQIAQREARRKPETHEHQPAG